MRKVMGVLAVSAFFTICLAGCETPPTGKPVAPNTPAPGGSAVTTNKNNASGTQAASTPVPTVNPNFNGAVGTKVK